MGWQATLLVFIAVCCTHVASLTSVEAQQKQTFEVAVIDQGPLGVQLDADLSIRAITSSARALNARHGVRPGDRIVAINGNPVSQNTGLAAFQEMLLATPHPLYLTIEPLDSQPRESVATSPPNKAEATMTDTAAVVMFETLMNSLVLSVPATDAEFSTESFCQARPLLIADSPGGCSAFHRNLTGSYVLLDRGGCSFFHKAFNAVEAGADGLIVVNIEDNTFQMASPEGRTLAISAVMVGRESGQRLKRMLLQHDGAVKVALQVSRHCTGKDRQWYHNTKYNGTSDANTAVPTISSQHVVAHPTQRANVYNHVLQPHISHQGIRWFAPNGTEIPYQYVSQLEKELARQNQQPPLPSDAPQ